MALNTINEIKSNLLLETENQTLTDNQIQTFLDQANEQMFAEIRRSTEQDHFTAIQETEKFFPMFKIYEIKAVTKTTDTITGQETTTLSSSDWEFIYDNDGIQISNLQRGDLIRIYYVPVNYKVLEKAIAMENILSRLNPFAGENINPSYATWRERAKNYKTLILKNFGTGTYY